MMTEKMSWQEIDQLIEQFYDALQNDQPNRDGFVKAWLSILYQELDSKSRMQQLFPQRILTCIDEHGQAEVMQRLCSNLDYDQ